jgi:RNA processing factor Prp31
MVDKPASPFASLGTDKALLRSTRSQTEDAPLPIAIDVPPLEVEQPSHMRAIPAEETTSRATRKARQPPRHKETSPSSNLGTTVSRYHGEAVETIRRAVRVVGKEAATYRFSPEEKARMADLIYTYKRQGIRTSENEVSRIALNFIFQDYEENGDGSVLAKVLDALNS